MESFSRHLLLQLLLLLDGESFKALLDWFAHSHMTIDFYMISMSKFSTWARNFHGNKSIIALQLPKEIIKISSRSSLPSSSSLLYYSLGGGWVSFHRFVIKLPPEFTWSLQVRRKKCKVQGSCDHDDHMLLLMMNVNTRKRRSWGEIMAPKYLVACTLFCLNCVQISCCWISA